MKTVSVFATVILLLLIAGCDRHLETRDPVRSVPTLTATPTNLVAVVNEREVVLSWQISSSSGIVRYRVYRSENENNGYTLVDSTQTLSVTIGGLPANRVFFFRVASVSTSGIEGNRSETISARAGAFGILIANNQRFTDSRDVQMRLTTGAPTSFVTLSEQSNMSDSVVLTFQTTVNYELTDGDGSKTVYAWFSFDDGSQSGDPVSDEIYLDTEAQIEALTFTPVSGPITDGDTVTFSLNVGESEGSASVSIDGTIEITLRNNGLNGDSNGSDDIFTGRFIIPRDYVLSDGEITGTFTDAAGNTAVPFISSQRLNAASALTPVELILAEALSSFEISIAWTQATTSSFIDYRVFRSTTPTVTDQSTLVTTISDTRVTSYVDTTLVDGAPYNYRVYLRDNLGRDTGSNIMGAVTLVNQSPKPVTVAGALEDGGTARLTWSTNMDHDFESYRIYRDNTAQVSPFDPMVGYIGDRNTTTFTDFLPGTWTSAFYRVYVYDRHGVESASNVIEVVK